MIRNTARFNTVLLILALSLSALANDYGAIRGVVHDPQHRPVQGAMVMLKAKVVRLDQDHHHRRQR